MFVSSSEALAELAAHCASFDRIALDTEADSLHCYFEKLCLIQISTPERDVLIDPLGDLDLAPLLEVLAKRELVLHGADFDLRLLRRGTGFQAGRIFDTTIAARLLGETEFSLSALIARDFGVTLSKQSQKANWALRPLPQKMVEYAVNDTHFLLSIAAGFEKRLHERGRWEWFQQSCEKVLAQAAITRERDLENAWRVRGSHVLGGRAEAVLRELWHWRETEARKIDRPPFHILQYEKLVEAAERLANGEQVAVSHGTRAKNFERAVDAALNLSPGEWPKNTVIRRPRPTPEEERRFKNLKSKRDEAAREHAIDPSLIAPKAALEEIARDEHIALDRMLPWQRVLLGFPAANELSPVAGALGDLEKSLQPRAE